MEGLGVQALRLLKAKQDETQKERNKNKPQLLKAKQDETQKERNKNKPQVFPDQTQKPEVIPTIMVIRYLIMNTVKSGVMGAKL
ncbi:hypothetical protein INR49_025162 [Caranx melampygus]|nr:hypothetical protein INR49_025162 [Caranx melampygus]